MPPKEFLQPSGLGRAAGYSHVVAARGAKTIYTAGQVAFNEAGQLVGAGDLRAQTRQVFENLRSALAAAGATFADVVKATIYVVDYQPSDRAAIVETRSGYFSKENPPASTLVGVQALAVPGLLVEIEVVAVID